MPRAEKLFSTRQKTRGENGGGAVVVEKNWRNRSIFSASTTLLCRFPSCWHAEPHRLNYRYQIKTLEPLFVSPFKRIHEKVRQHLPSRHLLGAHINTQWNVFTRQVLPKVEYLIKIVERGKHFFICASKNAQRRKQYEIHKNKRSRGLLHNEKVWLRETKEFPGQYFLNSWFLLHVYIVRVWATHIS
jgi:hypothetical protein